MNTLIPENGELISVQQKLSNDRILFINSSLDDELAANLCATILLKESEDSDKKITLFINCDGGDIRNIFMVYDAMTMVSCPIETICIGLAADGAALLLAAGTPGMRFATKNSIVTFGQLSHDWYSFGDLTDAKTILSQSIRNNKKMMEKFASHTGHTLEEVEVYFDRQVYLDSAQALDYQIVDKVI